MRKAFTAITMLIVMGFYSCTVSQPGAHAVRVRPAPPILLARPPMPAPGHVWVNGEWVWNGRDYVWKNGYWLAPRNGHRWQGGHWKKSRGGWYWVEGHWR